MSYLQIWNNAIEGQIQMCTVPVRFIGLPGQVLGGLPNTGLYEYYNYARQWQEVCNCDSDKQSLQIGARLAQAAANDVLKLYCHNSKWALQRRLQI